MSASARLSALGTTATVFVTDQQQLVTALELLVFELSAIDAACSRFRDDSELSRVNARAGERVETSELFLCALTAAIDAALATDGIVDPALGAHLRNVGYDCSFELVRRRGSWTIEPLPARGELWREIEIDEQCVRIPRGCELDFGATAKALAADRAAAAIARKTGCGVLVSLGGDVAVSGEAPVGGWSIRIADDHTLPLDAPGPCVSVGDGGLATSSTTVRRWPTDDGQAHHVLDPRTGLPAVTPWQTVSVAATSCVDANVASTAAIVLGDHAPTWLVDRALPARLVANDGGIVHVGGWPQS
ncbi:MAG TPA: FAD:protein FMN transferase [Gaiellaceae bacterium]